MERILLTTMRTFDNILYVNKIFNMFKVFINFYEFSNVQAQVYTCNEYYVDCIY